MSLTPVSSILRASLRQPKDKLNILCAPTHARYESGLAMTLHNFYAFQHPSFVKGWHKHQAPQPDNYICFDPNLGQDQIPLHLDFDLVLSQNKFGQFQILSQIAKQLHLPIVCLEHTLPHPQWPKIRIEETKKMRGVANVFISDYSIGKWDWEYGSDTYVIRHMVNTDIFTPGNEPRQRHILTVNNDYIGRDWCKPAGQKILTNLGYINIENICIGDKVLTDSGFEYKVIDTQSRDYFGPMVFIKIDGYNKEIGFTPTHNIRVYRNNQYQYIDSIRLNIGDKLKFPKLQTTEFNEYDSDLAYLIGNIIADGSITNKGYIQICVNLDDINRANYLAKILEKYTGNHKISERIRKDKNILRVEAKSKIFGLWLKDKIGNKSYEKYIPDDLFNNSQSNKLSVLQGLWVCDGSFKSGKNGIRLCYSTISIKLACQVSSLLHNFGIKCVIRKERRKTNKSKNKIKWIYRIVSASKDNVENCKNLIENSKILEPYSYKIMNVRIEEEWKGKVYNCTVEKDPSYIVYPGFVAHNCLNFTQYKNVTHGLPTFPVGDTPGLSKSAKSTEEMVKFYQTSRVFLNTAHISPIPTSLLEAMACGCACVSCDASDIPYYIKHGENGFLAKNDKEMRHYLDVLLNEDEVARKVGEEARKTILKKCSQDRFVSEWDDILRLSAEGIYRG